MALWILDMNKWPSQSVAIDNVHVLDYVTNYCRHLYYAAIAKFRPFAECRQI